MKKNLCTVAILAAIMAAPQAMAHKQGDILVRAGTATVVPNESSDDVLGLGEFGIDSNTQLGITVGYMLTDNISVELLAATPFRHSVSLNGVGKIAEIEHLPPTLMLQYYFMDSASKLSRWQLIILLHFFLLPQFERNIDELKQKLSAKRP